MNLSPIYNIAEICHQHGLEHVVLSPGSRCAPLTLAFVRHGSFKCKTIADERSAAFIALGIAQQTLKPTVLVCTSGSAALNYAPAIAEAYFQQIPLLIITADRPPEWIDQLDGQTIRQENIYGKHVKKSFNVPVAMDQPDAVWHGYRIVSEAINESLQFPAGPVHINIPFREPFYPEKDAQPVFDKKVKVIRQQVAIPNLPDEQWEQLSAQWRKSNRKLIVCGQQDFDKELAQLLESLSKTQKIPVAADIITNQHLVDEVISHSDLFLGQGKNGLHESLQPGLLVTFGKSTISKSLKLFLRKYPATEHWHIQPAGEYADTFQSLTQVLRTTPKVFMEKMSAIKNDEAFNFQKQENYYHLWLIEERKTRRFLPAFFPKEPLGEFEIVHHILSELNEADLHLANSMAVRYANLVGLTEKQNVRVYANRGTSGIDGSTSTAVGASLASDRETVLITGDMAFFYDRNAFWHKYPLDKLKVVVLNNHAGGIFRMIQGPADQPELEEYFETHQPLSAKHLAVEFGIEYIKCDKRSKLNNQLKDFFESKGPLILEIESESAGNKTMLDDLKSSFKALE